MAGYQPLNIKAFETGLVQSREEFLLPEDAYPTLQNAYIWRERIKRKQGYELLGRLRRTFQNKSVGVSGASPWSFNIFSTVSPAITETNAQIEPGSVIIYISAASVSGNLSAPGYTNSSNCEVTSLAHGLSTGDIISISGVVVVPNTGDNLINGGPYAIEVIDANHFKIGKDSHAWGIWQSGGTWTKETAAAQQLFDQGDGTLATKPPSSTTGVINYQTSQVTITNGSAGAATVINFNYFPGLPVMGIRQREQSNAVNDMTVFWDQTYAYIYNNGFQEFLPGTTWTGSDAQFFWTTNYWVSVIQNKIFWATNNNDPIRFTDGPGSTWFDFAPIINAGGGTLINALCLLPFRGRLLAFNVTQAGSQGGVYTNRIRWAAIGTPFTQAFGAVITTFNANAWRDDIRGQGGFLDIPTSQDIISVGFVRDNLVIYCERSTWQLRYTGRTIAPFQIEKVNSELGATGTFSTIQFDTSLLAVGDRGIIECDSYKADRIDIKIPDLVFTFNNVVDQDYQRIHGIRDFIKRLAYWTYPSQQANGTYPDKRLVYNYENDSWAIFDDSLTTLGIFQEPDPGRTWLGTPEPWIQCNFSWITQIASNPIIVGGNQQGFIEQLDQLTTNDPSLFISAITSNSPNATVVTSPNHNLQTGMVIKISGIPTGSPFSNLNNGIFGIVINDVNNFQLTIYSSSTGQFSTPQVDTDSGYIGGGQIAVRDNFSIVSKKLNFMDDGQSIQMGYLDILMDATEQTDAGSISLNVYLDYNLEDTSNTLPKNAINGIISPGSPDLFFNQNIPTSRSNTIGGSKFWQRVFCPTRANFLTLEYTFSNAQMAGIEQTLDVQIDAQILWIRRGGRLTQSI